MNGSQPSWMTPTTCFSIACVAFSLVAASTVWRHQQWAPASWQKKVTIQAESAEVRPQHRRRRAVDCLYTQSGDELYDTFTSALKVDIDGEAILQSQELEMLVERCARLCRQLRAVQDPLQSRISLTSLLSELSLLTATLYRLQQLMNLRSDILNIRGQNACLSATTSSLRSTLQVLDAELMSTPVNATVVDEVIRQLRDQRPALNFLLDILDPRALPPTPPAESSPSADLTTQCATEYPFLSPPLVQTSTGLTPAVDSKPWAEPPPEYSPPINGIQGVVLEKAGAKIAASAPPQLQNDEQHEEYDSDALYNAVTQNDLGLVKDLLALGASPNEAVGELQRTALHQAAHLSHILCMSSLLRSGAEMSVEDSKGDTPLHLAAWAGHVEALQSLLAHGADIDWLSGRDGYSPLWCAISAYHIDAARLLLKQGARVSLRSASGGGLTPLHQAAVTGQSAMCELLLERGAQVDAVDAEKNTALHYAAVSGSAPSVQILLRNAARVDSQQVHGLTPLHWAAHKGHTDVLELLLAHGAPVDAVSEDGATPLHLAANRDHVMAVRALLHRYCNTSLMAIWDGCEGTAAQMAKVKGHTRVVRALQGL